LAGHVLPEDVHGGGSAFLVHLAHDAHRVCKLGSGDVASGEAPHDRLGHQRQAEREKPVGEAHRYGMLSRQRWAMGIRRPSPKAFDVIRRPGAACLRLYSLRSTRWTMLRTTAGSSPIATISAAVFPSSM